MARRTGQGRKSGRKGQGWTFDYIISMLIFIVASLLAVRILLNVSPGSAFEDAQQDAILISGHLLSTGHPEYWNDENIVRLGLASSRNRISMARVRNYLNLNYTSTKTLLGVSDNYAFYFLDSSGNITGVEGECALGSPELSEIRTLYKELRPSAYYYRDETFMAGYMTAIGADFYDGNQDEDVDTFYQNLSSYEFVVMENPLASEGGSLSEKEKTELLDSFIREGGVLYASENTSINITGIRANTTVQVAGAEVVSDDDGILDLTIGRTIDDNDATDASFKIPPAGVTVLAEYSASTEPFMVRWNYGLGEVYYFGTFNAKYKGGPSDLDLTYKASEGLQEFVNSTQANCTSVGIDSLDSENIGRVERFSVLDSGISRMVVLAWN